MSQKGEHTWDINIHYHECPKCGFIIENRNQYQKRSGRYQKELECDRCHYKFTATKRAVQRFGPLLGEAEPVEIDWGE